MTQHILVVDDDPGIRDLVADYLAAFDFRVSSAGDAQQLREVLKREAVDLVVLDIRLPGEDGISVMRSLRQASRIPIILVTTRHDEVDRILGLELGADDYLAKPFNPRELLARVRAVLRRMEPALLRAGDAEGARALRFAGWELELGGSRLLSPAGDRVDLTHAEARLLRAFLNAPHRTLSRDELLELSRGHSDDVFDRSIDVSILRLRRKLELDPRRPELIKTERGAGYFLDANVDPVD